MATTATRAVSLAGDVTISHVRDARDALAVAMRESQAVVVDVSQVSEADLTSVQLLEAARRKAEVLGINLSLSAPADGALLEVLKRGGFVDGTGERATFWLQGAYQ